jgi:hypothetical protein
MILIPEIENRIMDILKNIEKVCADYNKITEMLFSKEYLKFSGLILRSNYVF